MRRSLILLALLPVLAVVAPGSFCAQPLHENGRAYYIVCDAE